MPPIPFLVLLAWIPLGALLFRLFPVRWALLMNWFGGWAILPGANYIPTEASFPYWIEGVCLPGAYFLTKATSIGIAGLAGFALFHRASWIGFRPRPIDLPIALGCAAPLVTAAVRPGTLREALAGTLYLTLAWGAPWLLGRICFRSPGSLLLIAKAAVLAGVCYIPICLVEFATGPILYALLYGYQPYRWVGAQRYLGFRPIGLLEDGNQLGIWMASAALLAVALASHRLIHRILGLPAPWVAAALVATALLCQSAGSILLLALLLPLAVSARRTILRIYGTLSLAGILAFIVLLMTGHASLRALAQRNRIAHSIAQGLQDVGRHSLVWRIARDESHIAIALRHPFLGTGQWNWWQNGDARPWSLWLLVFGMYGSFGLAAFGSILFLPMGRAVWRLKASLGSKSDPHVACIAVLLMIALDSLLNGAMLLPYVLLMAGLASLPASSAPPVEFPDNAPRAVNPDSQPPELSPGAAESAPEPPPRSNSAAHP